MSVTMDAVLIGYPLSDELRKTIDEHDFDEHDRNVRQSFGRLNSGAAGGSKYASWDVWQACFNYVGRDAVLEWFENLVIEPGDTLVLTLDHENDEEPTVITRGF